MLSQQAEQGLNSEKLKCAPVPLSTVSPISRPCFTHSEQCVEETFSFIQALRKTGVRVAVEIAKRRTGTTSDTILSDCAKEVGVVGKLRDMSGDRR